MNQHRRKPSSSWALHQKLLHWVVSASADACGWLPGAGLGNFRSSEARSRQVLGCTPRESFVWLLAFNLEVLHGRLNEQSFNLLAMSYETSPNEAWISIRRIIVATPLVLAAPEPVRQKILFEFQRLIRNGFEDDAARSYFTAPGSVRSLLQTQIEQLDLPRQKKFSDALQRLRS